MIQLLLLRHGIKIAFRFPPTHFCWSQTKTLQTIESSWTFAYGLSHICYFNLNDLQVCITKHLVCLLIPLGFLNPIKLKSRLMATLYLNGEISKFSEFILMHCFLFRDHRAKNSTRQEEMCFVVVISFMLLWSDFIAVFFCSLTLLFSFHSWIMPACFKQVQLSSCWTSISDIFCVKISLSSSRAEQLS